MVALHMALDRPLTKLAILQHAVTLITELERQVRGMGRTQFGGWAGRRLAWPRAGSGIVRINPLHFLAGCRKRLLSQLCRIS